MNAADWFIFGCSLVWGAGCGFIGFAFAAWRKKHLQWDAENRAYRRGFKNGITRRQATEQDPADWWKN